jgi:hypothetical protein
MNTRWAGGVRRSGRCELKLRLVDGSATGRYRLGTHFGLGLSAASFANLLLRHGEFGGSKGV